jgi:hypothetical protein
MKKRGDITLWFLFELLGAFLIGYMAVNISLAYAKGTIHEKLNIAKDIAIQINALASIPGDAYIINRNLHGYSLYFSDNKIEVFENNFDQIKGTYYFVKIGDTKLDLRLDKPKQVVIAKIGSEIKISEEIPKLK